MVESMNEAAENEAAEDSPQLSGKRGVWIALAVAVGLLAYAYWPTFLWLEDRWANSADYSHGYLVVPFSLFLLWSRRDRVLGPTGDAKPSSDRTGMWLGFGILVVAGALRWSGGYTRIYSLELLSLIPALIGIFALLFGRRGIRWSFAPVAFLVFMMPLPGAIADQLGGSLQALATTVSTFSLQTLGFPATAEGNVITLSQGQIGVAEACSGLRMLVAFFALSVGACLLIDRSMVEKWVIAVSAIPIAIAANCIRIVTTGIAFEYFSADFAERLFHDFAGWMMMPVGFGLLLVALAILDRLIVPVEVSEIGVVGPSR